MLHSSEGILLQRCENINQYSTIENCILKLDPDVPGTNESLTLNVLF